MSQAGRLPPSPHPSASLFPPLTSLLPPSLLLVPRLLARVPEPREAGARAEDAEEVRSRLP